MRRGARRGALDDRRARREHRSPVSLQLLGVGAGLACLWAFAFVSDVGSGLYHGGSLVFSLAVAAVIWSAVQPGWSPLGAVLSVSVLRWIGRISYGLYLWHWPAIVVLTEDRTGLSGAPLTFVRLATTFAGATLSFYLVEQPIRRGALRGRKGLVAVPTGFAAAAGLIVIATVGASATSPLTQVQAGQKLAGPRTPTAAAANKSAAASRAPAGQPKRVLLVGDSIPYTLLPGLQPLAAERGVTVDTALVAGCGVVGGVASYNDGQVPPHAPGCAQQVDDYERTALNQDRPEIVVWMSNWEINDRIVQGERFKFGGAAWDDMMLGQIDQAARRLTASNAHLLIATMPPRAPNELLPASDSAEVARYVRLNELYRQFARAHTATVSIVDFAGLVCPGGAPCPRTIDGIEPRPLDGVHFTPQTASWASRRLLDAVLACRPAPAGWLCPEQASAGTGNQAARK
jgi:hypothetical protein